MFEIDGSTTQARPIPNEPALRARARLLGTPLARSGRARARRRGRPRSRPSRRGCPDGVRYGNSSGADEVPARQLGRVEAEPPGRDRHRPLECEVELGAAEAAVEPGRAAVRQHDAVACRDVAGRDRRRTATRASGRGLPAPARGRRRRRPPRRRSAARAARRRAANAASTPVLRAVDAELPARCSSRSSIQRTGTPSLRDGEADQDDVDVDGRLDPEAAARVRRRDQPQLRARQAERGGRDRVEGEGALEVRPGGERARGLVPVGDDAVALDRGAAPAREVEAAGDDEVGGERRRRRDRRRRTSGRRQRAPACPPPRRVEHRGEGLVLDLDQLERVLGRVAIACDDDGERLARRSARPRARPRDRESGSRRRPERIGTWRRRRRP